MVRAQRNGVAIAEPGDTGNIEGCPARRAGPPVATTTPHGAA